MTKNIKVTDNNGNELGYTYPKRVKGLIKNGRAQYVDDCTIRLSKVSPDEKSEAEQMKYILLNPRDWSEKDGVEHSFIDGFEGKLEEIIQLGTWDTESVAESKHYLLDADKEYSLVFWLNGGENEKADEICDLLICFNLRNPYKNRYKLNRNYIKPLLHFKGWELYSIPFTTPSDNEAIDVNFCFRAKKAPMAVKAAKEPGYYEAWKDELDEFADKRPQRHNIVFEDGWPSIYMYGGNRYSTEILRKLSNKNASNSGVSGGTAARSDNSVFTINLFNSIDELEEFFDELRDDYENLVDSLSDVTDAYEDLLDRCDDNSFADKKSEIMSELASEIENAKERLSKVNISEYESRIPVISTKTEGEELNALLAHARDVLNEVEGIVDELEGHIDDFDEEIDELENEDEED